MGGGDLNQKKSWHPHTIKNQEKVWKAQQAKSQEEKRLKELQKEISDERNREELRRIGESSGVLAKSDADKKLEWMYKSSVELVNREEYLLGRSVDKTFETLQAEEQKKDANMMGVKQPINHVEHECIPFSIRDYKNLSLDNTEQVDLQRKQMEDPLMLIKQREMESRRKLLENPVKLKELHRILKTDQQLSKKKKSKKSKSKKSKESKKKHKKRSKSSSDSDTTNSDSDDLDAQLAKKYNKIKGSLLEDSSEFKSMSLNKLLDAKYDTISKELDKAVKTKRKHQNISDESGDNVRRENREYQQTRRNARDRSRSEEQKRKRNNRDTHRRRSYSRERNQKRKTDSDRRDRSRSYDNKRRQDNRKSCNTERQAKRSSPSPSKTERRPALKDPPKMLKLTEEEKEARRREMMENAAWRETDRTTAVNRHREAYAREEQQNRSLDFDKDFINKEVKRAISNHSSIETRIRSNLNNIQRTSSAMNSNFARK